MNNIKCNKCGQSVNATNISLDFSFPSKFNSAWQFSLCDICLLDIVKTFEFAPEGFMRDSHYVYLTDNQQEETFNNFKETGEWDALMSLPYEILIECRGYYEDEYINECIRKYHPNKPLLV